MATIPQPRSFNAIVGDMVSAFLSRFGIRALKTGSPVLSIIEAAAQSDLRSSQDIFDMLNSQSLDSASGTALDRIAADEDLERLGESPASGEVTVTDASITKVSSKLYQGQPAPIVGSASIYVVDATDFTDTGTIYVGRGTTNYEGPLEYSAKTDLGSYWKLDLVDNTRKFHNLGETVILGQGGNRTVSAGSIVQTPQGNVVDAVQFATLFDATIPDGETEITDVQVLAQRPGLDSNVTAAAINAFVSDPFTGATVTNPLPFSNGQASESDEALRERIRHVRASRSKGTPLAIETSVQGITATDENKRVLSAVVVSHEGQPTTLYIDDGTGYEEQQAGIAIETLVDRATGGEQYFQLSQRPVAKANLVTLIRAPFPLRSGSSLAVRCGGVITEHTFESAEFRNIANASAYEVAASINGNPSLDFSASTTDSGTKVKVFARADTNEDVEVVAGEGVNANEDLLFPSGRADSLRLYRNDQLLSKDGELAVVAGNPLAQWLSLIGDQTLTLAVDGTPEVEYEFTDLDFSAAGTDYSTIGHNSVQAWADVINAKIPGITASDANGLLTLTSNLGRNGRAQVQITGGTLVSNNMFEVSTATGVNRDYTLDRNTSQIRLEQVLAVGDSLAAGSINTRAFVESGAIGTITILAGDAHLYVVVDGAVEAVPTTLAAGLDIDVTAPTGDTVQFAAASGTPFTEVEAGDWVIIQDPGFDAGLLGSFRVAEADPTFVTIEKGDSTGLPVTATLTSSEGMVVVRTSAEPQLVTIPAGTVTAANIVDEINDVLVGAVASTYRTSRLRIRSNSFEGDITVVAADVEGKKLLLPLGDMASSETPHLVSVKSGNGEVGTPAFTICTVDTVVDADTVTPSAPAAVDEWMAFDRNLATGLYGQMAGLHAGIESVTVGGDINVLDLDRELVVGDRYHQASSYRFGPNHDLVVVADSDETGKRFQVPFWRKLKPTTSSYGATNYFKDADNSDQSLAKAWGLEYDFTDHAIFMAARVKTHAADASKSLLWRYKRLGLDGELARVRYVYPSAPESELAVDVDLSLGTVDISVALPSGAEKVIATTSTTTKVGLASTDLAGDQEQLTYLFGYSVSSAVRTVRLDYTGGTGSMTGTVTGAINGYTATVVSDSGTYFVLTGATGAFTAGEGLSFSGGGSATSSGAQYGYNLLTVTLPTGITSHGLANGSYYLKSTDEANFSSGIKAMASVSATTLSYLEGTGAGATAATASDLGTVSNDVGEVTLAGISPAVAVGDIFSVGTGSGFASAYEGVSMRITAVGSQYIQGIVDSGPAAVSVPSWESLIDPDALAVFPLADNTATAIAAAVAALDSKCPVTATVTGTGAGSIEQSSSDENATADYWYSLVDGINWVQSQVNPPLDTNHYQFTLKEDVSAGLASDSDWLNEDIRLVPVSAATVSSWLNAPATSALSGSCNIDASDRAKYVQIASKTAGSTGSIQVQGGWANTGAAAVQGSGSVIASAYAMVSVPTSDAESFTAGSWVAADNTQAQPKTVFTSATTLTSIASDGVFTVGAVPVWENANSGPITAETWRIETHGAFVAYIYSKALYGALAGGAEAGIEEGDWVYITGVAGNGLNEGTFSVVRTYSDADFFAFWVENENAVEEDTAIASVRFLTHDSLLPGDTINIGSSIWGSGNQGLWTVEFVGGTDTATAFTSQYVFTVNTQDAAPVTQAAVGALGTSAPLIKAIEGQPGRLLKRIRTIAPNQDDADSVDILFETDDQAHTMSEAAGTILTALDRLDFPVDVATGIDGYGHGTGLVAESNRVLYGDSRDTATYPGVVAAGARVNISGPLVKRVTVSLSIRVRSGISSVDIIDAVKSAVASTVNGAKVGEAIAISDIVAAAGKVNGVIAVAVLSPSYSADSDLIPVQPYEKPLVLNLDQDVSVSLVGE
jgi:hypothetical protein